MIKYLIILFFIFTCFNFLTSEIIGLDSLKFNTESTITIIKKDAKGNYLDSIFATIKIIEKKNNNTQDILITYNNKKDEVKLISGDTTFIINDVNGSYRKYYSNEFKISNEITMFYYYLYKKRDITYLFTKIDEKKIIESKTSINPEQANVIYETVTHSLEKNITSIEKLTIGTINLDVFDLKAHVLIGSDTIHQLSVNYIYSNNTDSNIINRLSNTYQQWQNNKFDLEEFEQSISLKKPEIVGKELKTNYILEGLNRESIDLQKEIKNNELSVIYTWGTWCAPCMQNTENIEKFFSTSQLPFYSIMFEFNNNPLKKMKKYIDSKKTIYPVYRCDEFIIDNELKKFPEFLIINSQGQVINAYIGKPKNYNVYLDLIKECTTSKLK